MYTNNKEIEEQCWKVQLECAKLVLLMDDARYNTLTLNLMGKYHGWEVRISHEDISNDHGDDELRSNHER